jgi:hypothetical protein
MSVDAALNRVRNNLNENWLDWDVTESELKDSTQALKELSPSERNEAIGKLSDDELKHWAAETKGLNSPLNADDRRDLLNVFAKDLDASQLARVSKAFGATDVAASVASHTPADRKAEYIQALQGDADGAAKIEAGFGVSSATAGNDNARAIAQVLGSLKDSPAQFASAVQGLEQAGKLDDVMKAASGERLTTVTSGRLGGATTTISFDDKQLQDILAGAAALPPSDLATRTSLFKAGAQPLASMQQSAARGLTNYPNGEAAQRTGTALGKVLTREQAEAAGIVDKQTMPPGVSMDQNIKESHAHSVLDTTGWFKSQVQNKGPWDYKQQGAQYQDFGNFNFGLTAAATGIPEQVALRGAGDAQTKAGTSQDGWGGPWDLNGGPYGDDPADQAQIKKGYEYYNSGLWRVWSD